MALPPRRLARRAFLALLTAFLALPAIPLGADPQQAQAGRRPARVVQPPTLQPGAGFQGLLPDPDPLGSGPAADALVAARWDCIPFQTIDAPFELGVVAFHVNGIDRVEFSLEDGPWVSVDEMTWNPRTRLEEYWVVVDPSLLPDGPFVVRAVAYPEAGVPRILTVPVQSPQAGGAQTQDLIFHANAGNTLSPYLDLYVARDSGSDLPRVKGTRESPFKTLNRALSRVYFKQPNTYQRVTITLIEPGDYHLFEPNYTSHPDIRTPSWITIQADAGLTPDEVCIVGDGRAESFRPKIQRAHWKGVSFDQSTRGQYYPEGDHYTWFDRCVFFDSNGWTAEYPGVPTLYPFRTASQVVATYATDCVAQDMLYGLVRIHMVRNSHLQRISGDALQNTAFVLGCTVDEMDGTVSEHHTDLLQYFGAYENLIVYGVKATDLYETQSIFLDWNASSFTNSAFVNVLAEFTGVEPPLSQLSSAHDHVLFLHVTDSQSLILRDDQVPPSTFVASDVLFQNCILRRLYGSETPLPAGVEARNCHFLVGDLHGSSPTTGNVTILDQGGRSFVYSGPGAPLLGGTGLAMPGFSGRHDGSALFGSPSRGAFSF